MPIAEENKNFFLFFFFFRVYDMISHCQVYLSSLKVQEIDLGLL